MLSSARWMPTGMKPGEFLRRDIQISNGLPVPRFACYRPGYDGCISNRDTNYHPGRRTLTCSPGRLIVFARPRPSPHRELP